MPALIPRPQPLDPEVAALADEHRRDKEAVLPILQALDARRGTLNRQTILEVARILRLPPERVQGVATFYAMLSTAPEPKRMVRLCDGVVCWLKGAAGCRQALEGHVADDPDWTVARASCLGLCDRAPAAFIEGRQCGPLTPETTGRLLAHWSGPLPSYREPRPGEARLVLDRAGRIDPRSIDDALGAGAWRGLEAALAHPAEEVVAQIKQSGLRGRGGAGYPTGHKWRMVAEAAGPDRYVVCNADESEPLTFKDRVLLESDPHLVLEGMALAGYAVGATRGIIYIRGEYEPQARLLEHAVRQATECGRLGENIAGSRFSFDIDLHRGAGAYICGEETALLESLEGRRGEPRTRPPYPAQSGLRGRPTVVNNVETFAAAAVILGRGLDLWRAQGPAGQPGTRLFTLLGQVRQPGLVELPLGLSLREIIDRFGGGLLPGSRFHFALTGGAAGTLVPESLLDVPLDFASSGSGVALGSGGLLVCDETVSPVALLRELMHFFEAESCGKCTPCRIGTSEARRTLDLMLAGEGSRQDLDRLRRLAASLKTASFCGLGTSAADPLNSALQHFAPEFESRLGGSP